MCKQAEFAKGARACRACPEILIGTHARSQAAAMIMTQRTGADGGVDERNPTAPTRMRVGLAECRPVRMIEPRFVGRNAEGAIEHDRPGCRRLNLRLDHASAKLPNPNGAQTCAHVHYK